MVRDEWIRKVQITTVGILFLKFIGVNVLFFLKERGMEENISFSVCFLTLHSMTGVQPIREQFV
jgi:hypothetical protein